MSPRTAPAAANAVPIDMTSCSALLFVAVELAPVAVPVPLVLDPATTVVVGYAEPRALISNSWDVA